MIDYAFAGNKLATRRGSNALRKGLTAECNAGTITPPCRAAEFKATTPLPRELVNVLTRLHACMNPRSRRCSGFSNNMRTIYRTPLIQHQNWFCDSRIARVG